MLMATPSAGWCTNEHDLGRPHRKSTAPPASQRHPEDGAPMTVAAEEGDVLGDGAELATAGPPRSVARAAAGMGAATAVSRVVGALRVLVIASVLGTTVLGNVFQ